MDKKQTDKDIPVNKPGKKPFAPNPNSTLDWDRVQQLLEENKELLKRLAEDD